MPCDCFCQHRSRKDLPCHSLGASMHAFCLIGFIAKKIVSRLLQARGRHYDMNSHVQFFIDFLEPILNLRAVEMLISGFHNQWHIEKNSIFTYMYAKYMYTYQQKMNCAKIEILRLEWVSTCQLRSVIMFFYMSYQCNYCIRKFMCEGIQRTDNSKK